MSTYTAEVVWQVAGAFADNLYSRAHLWRFDGGVEIKASASPGSVRAPLSDPAAVDPEEALVASVSSCHMLWFLDLARQAGFAVSAYHDAAAGTLGRDDRGRISMTRFVLKPRIAFDGPSPDPEELARLHAAAHERCFIANSLRAEVIVA